MKIYEILFEITVGEYEHYERFLRGSASYETISRWVEESLASYFGEDTIKEGHRYYDPGMTIAVKLEHIREVDGFVIKDLDTGKFMKFELKESEL